MLLALLVIVKALRRNPDYYSACTRVESRYLILDFCSLCILHMSKTQNSYMEAILPKIT